MSETKTNPNFCRITYNEINKVINTNIEVLPSWFYRLLYLKLVKHLLGLLLTMVLYNKIDA
jgi:hypothetical protein